MIEKIKKTKNKYVIALFLCLLTGCSNNISSGNNNQDIEQNKNIDDISESVVQDTRDIKSEKSNTQETQDLEDRDIIDLEKIEVEENGTYMSKEEVAAYIHKYNKLPSNFITEEEAKALGWVSKEGNLSEVAPGKSVGGEVVRSGHYVSQSVDKKVGKKEGRIYYMCDINYTGGFRGAERLIYSNDGVICYTPDHYETFEVLYR